METLIVKIATLLNMFSEIKNIFSILLSVAFSSIGFIAAITVAALSVREVSTNPYLVGFPNALGVGGAFVGTQIYDCLLYTSPSPRDRG